MLINNKNEDNNQNDEKTFTQTEINEMQVSRIRHLVNLFADMNECYDMAGLFIRMQQELSDVCKEVRLKSLICEISTKSDNKADLTTEFSTTIYDVEGPEFDSINYDLNLPDGSLISCSANFLDFYPEELQIVQTKMLLEVVCLYVSRARIGTLLSDYMHTDSDTGLPNMQAFLEFGEKLVKDFKITDYTVIALNITNFKFVNQTVPFDLGTLVLIRYAHKLLGLMHPGEIVTRFGGDNFNVLIKKNHAAEFLDQIRMIPIDIKNKGLHVHFDLSCYAGIYEIDSRMSIQSALENATNAKNVAKKSAHDPFVYYNEEMGEKQHYSNQIRAKFKSAMLNHEFIAYYQPKVNIVTQELIGMEALVRWETEEGSVNPQDFVGIFEDTSAIIELDRCMLLQVCRDIKRWESMGLSVPRISVNLSRRNLNNYDVADIVASVLDEYHVDHDKVEIEVTETVNSEGFESLSQFISKMKKYGIKVSIDDFGTGYSSLNLLKNLNADVLKIDRSFVDLEEFTEKDELLVKSIVELAKSYSMETIMEGVENEEQIRFLYKCGCMNVQGYFFDRPLTKEAVTERIQLGKYDKKYKLK